MTSENSPQLSFSWTEKVTVRLLVPLTFIYMESFIVTLNHRTTSSLPMTLLSEDVVVVEGFVTYLSGKTIEERVSAYDITTCSFMMEMKLPPLQSLCWLNSKDSVLSL